MKRTVLLTALLLAGCSESGRETFQNLSVALSPEAKARLNYDRSVKAYRTCMTANESKPSACEAERFTMEGNQHIVAAKLSAPVAAPASQTVCTPDGPYYARTVTCVPIERGKFIGDEN